MRTIIAGSKLIATYQDLVDAIESAPFKPTAIVVGLNRHIDQLSERYALEKYLPVCRVALNIKEYGEKAAYMRNIDMVKMSEAIIVLWSSMNRDTECILETAREYGLQVYITNVKSIDNESDDSTIDVL